MRVTANGKRRRDTQVGVFVKAPAVTVLDARPGRAQRALSGRVLTHTLAHMAKQGKSKDTSRGARNALRIWIRGEWGDRRRVRGVRTSSSEKDSAEKRLENG
jgi:hypothetical protein